MVLQLGCRVGPPPAPLEAGRDRPVEEEVRALSPQQEQWLADLCLFGAPRWIGEPQPSDLVVRAGYALRHHAELRVPLWVCEHLERSDLVRDADRPADRGKCNWKADKEIPAGRQATPADYTGVGERGFDRGHNAPSSDYTYSQERMCDTFILSNIAPQRGANFNQSIWRVLEDRVQAYVAESGEAWIITGTMFYAAEEDDPNTADGVVRFERVGKGRIPVPTHFFKIVAARIGASWEAVAFVMANVDYERLPDKQYQFCSYIQPIVWLERRTGFNFFPTAGMQIDELEKGDCWPVFHSSN